MKRYLISVICVALAGSAWAQSPVGVVSGPQANNQVVPIGATTAATEVMGTTAQVGTLHPGHCDGGCPKTKTVCVPEPTTVKNTKVVFSSECATVCTKGCNLLKKGGDCNSCKDGACGRSHVEHYLYKRVQTQVCDSFKCVPTQVPVCAAPKCATCAPKCTSACAAGTCCGSAAVVPGQPASVTPTSGVANTPASETIIIVPTQSAAPSATNSAASRLP